MARPGRKRKLRKRKPSGRLTQERTTPPVEFYRRRAEIVGPENVHKWDGSVLHKYVLKGQISPRQRWAAVEYAKTKARFVKALKAAGCKIPKQPVALDPNKVISQGLGDMKVEDFLDLWRAYLRAWDAVGSTSEHRALNAALDEQDVASIERLQRALDNLIEHFEGARS